MAVRRAMLMDALPRLRGQRVTVVGDMLLDEYVYGSVARVSREAPVLVLEHEREVAQPGGGAFPALAVRAMGGDATMIGCVGQDGTGETLLMALGASGVDTTGVVIVPSPPIARTASAGNAPPPGWATSRSSSRTSTGASRETRATEP
jgi:bifunctional ADP-heptose synthase (sugar kinase/adenylyltransferase)